MKVPPKRKGNYPPVHICRRVQSLNESPSEKEGKWGALSELATGHLDPQ